MAALFDYTALILILPILSFVILALTGMKMSHKLAGLFGTTVLGVVLALCYYTAYEYFFVVGRAANGVYATLVPLNFHWLNFTKTLSLDLGILLDPITVMMLIVISTVSFMVHVYSFGYMHGEKGFQRYYAFLSLFTFSMLGLVMATNIFQMYIFWELVGVCSYLLIGFYYPQHAAVAASKKAFIVTRFADMFFLLGILIYSYYTGSFSFDFTNTFVYGADASVHAQTGMATAIAAGSKTMFFTGLMLPTALFLMFIGGAGKSAMFPLHIWLPDAMEGPTPVSALIHAATMVVAGVFQVARMFPLWIHYAPDTLQYVAWIGAFTAFYAAAVACAQSDIKRVLAFSTISQIAFMMVALGCCSLAKGEEGLIGYTAGMFHLFTHAMFKGLLFLCAGCIIHTIGSNFYQYMGGLRKYMPVTCTTFGIACLAISGIPPFSGFFSKDMILDAAYIYSPVMGWIMSIIAAMTAFYMFRVFYLIFFGKNYYEQHVGQIYEVTGKEITKPHEAPACMTIPLIILAAISCVAGFIPAGNFVTADGLAHDIPMNWSVASRSIIFAVVAIALATYMYAREDKSIPKYLEKKLPRLHQAALRRFYMDEVWQFITHKVIFGCVSTPIAWFDRRVIDGAMNFSAWGTNVAGETIRPWQSGDVRQYAVWFITGSIALTLILLCI